MEGSGGGRRAVGGGGTQESQVSSCLPVGIAIFHFLNSWCRDINLSLSLASHSTVLSLSFLPFSGLPVSQGYKTKSVKMLCEKTSSSQWRWGWYPVLLQSTRWCFIVWNNLVSSSKYLKWRFHTIFLTWICIGWIVLAIKGNVVKDGW